VQVRNQTRRNRMRIPECEEPRSRPPKIQPAKMPQAAQAAIGENHDAASNGFQSFARRSTCCHEPGRVG